jgi:two-component system chemotaxis response regulator CheY
MRKVLVVEDSPAMRGLIVSVLDQIEDCDVIEVPNGFEALRRLPREEFALVVTDINMPDINGLELLTFIRKGPHPETPVIIVSSEASEKDMTRGLALGANAYLTKPFSPEDLEAAARRLMGLSK